MMHRYNLMHSMSYKLVTAVDLTVLVGALFFFFFYARTCVLVCHMVYEEG